MQGHRSWVLCVSWSPDAQMVVTGGMDGALWLWDPKTGNSIGCCKGGAVYGRDPPYCMLIHSYLTPSLNSCSLDIKHCALRYESNKLDGRLCRAHKMDHSSGMGARSHCPAMSTLCQRLQRHHHQGLQLGPALSSSRLAFQNCITPCKCFC